MNQSLFVSVVLVLVFYANAYCQLPPRPAPGQAEEAVAAELALKLDDLFGQYTANFKCINRFVGLATLDRTWKRKGQPLHTDLMWFIHAQDFDRHVRRMDELTSTFGPLGNGTQRIGVLIRSTIETDEGVMQYQTQNSVNNVLRESVEKDEDFGRRFRIQTRLDFWELPFHGSFEVRIQGTYPKLVWRELPRTPALFQERGRVTAWHEDLKQVLARVSFDSGFAYDFTFSKDQGNMPTRVVQSRNDERVQAVTAIVDTQWFPLRNNEFPQPVYLPAQLHCDFEDPGSGNGHDTHELQIRWIVGKEVREIVFSQESELFMDSVEIKETVLANAVNKG
jgi:hypothetical protein